jgi:hypothetical protein
MAPRRKHFSTLHKGKKRKGRLAKHRHVLRQRTQKKIPKRQKKKRSHQRGGIFTGFIKGMQKLDKAANNRTGIFSPAFEDLAKHAVTFWRSQ